jgi:Na+/melibiose symporter-like transporter
MEAAIGDPDESAGQTCYRRRWAFAGAGITLCACMMFMGLILALPFRSERRTLGIFLMVCAGFVGLFCVVLPLCAKAVKKRASTDLTTPATSLPPFSSDEEEDDFGPRPSLAVPDEKVAPELTEL